MKHLWKFLLPVLLGAAAAAANFLALASRETAAPVGVVQVKAKSLDADAPLPATMNGLAEQFAECKLSIEGVTGAANADADEKKQAAAAIQALGLLPWSDRHVLLGAGLTGDLKRGALVSPRDLRADGFDFKLEPGEQALALSLNGVDVDAGLLRVGRHVNFVVSRGGNDGGNGGGGGENGAGGGGANDRTTALLGPFRIVSVGARLAESIDGGLTDGGGGRDVTVAVRPRSGRLDGPDADLVTALRNGAVVAVTFLPLVHPPAAGAAAGPTATGAAGAAAAASGGG